VWQKIADALGVPERGVELLALLSARLEAVRSAVRVVTEPTRPRVAVLEWCAPH
jgi:ABC-type Fe3+-hydroxamate transport system substrate-binding protein